MKYYFFASIPNIPRFFFPFKLSLLLISKRLLNGCENDEVLLESMPTKAPLFRLSKKSSCFPLPRDTGCVVGGLPNP